MKILIALPLVLLLSVSAYGANCTVTSVGLQPVNYVRSADTLQAGLNAANLVQPLDVNGTPSPTGKIGFLGIGMSNAAMVSEAFRANYLNDQTKHPLTTYITGAVSSKTAAEWASATDASGAWAGAAQRVADRGLTSAQIQWAHVVMIQKNPGQNGPMTETQVRAIVNNLIARYPHVHGVWLSGINYVGYSVNTPAREPFVHAASVLMASLVGTLPVFSDFLDWWSDGTTPNPYTGLSWHCGDVVSDGIHPSQAGKNRIALMMTDRWRVDPVMSWMWVP